MAVWTCNPHQGRRNMTQWPPSPVYLAKDRISKKNKPANNLRVLCNYFMSRENIIKKKKSGKHHRIGRNDIQDEPTSGLRECIHIATVGKQNANTNTWKYIKDRLSLFSDAILL